MTDDMLKQLQAEIERTPAVDDKQAANMADLQNHIQARLDNSAHHPSLIEAMERSAVLFQADHPKLAEAIRSALDILSEGGV